MLEPLNAIARFDNKYPISGQVLEVNPSGLTVRLESAAPEAMHLWLLFGLPDGSGDCLTLGKILERQGSDLRIGFKHLFPKDRRALQNSLGTEEAVTIAA